MSSKLKREIQKKAPSYIDELVSGSLEIGGEEGGPPPPKHERGATDPASFMKHMDTGFESFFYKRAYTERNFQFYFQICAKQYKSEEALRAFRRMETMGIRPTEYSYNQLVLNFAKKRDLDMVMKL